MDSELEIVAVPPRSGSGAAASLPTLSASIDASRLWIGPAGIHETTRRVPTIGTESVVGEICRATRALFRNPGST